MEGKIQKLEELEARLAQEYGMTDADAVRQETKARSTFVGDPRYHEYMQLYELNYLRRRMARTTAAGGVSNVSRKIDGVQFWAVIIGINEYSNDRLKGCVSDALSIQDYITKDLGVPQDHIHLLLDESATRVNIISALCGLSSDNRILHGDIILIYFAGHGSGYPEPGHWEDGPDNAIEAICPVDRGTELIDGTLIPDISDRELNAILSVISSVKGHRLTVFLDCGFVGTHFRDFPQPGARSIRSLMNRASPLDMLRASDKDLAHFPGYQSVLDPDWTPDEDCFIMVVASQEYGYAKEVQFKGQDGFHGVFTYSLLRALRSEDLPERPTYIDVLLTMPVFSYQTPGIMGSSRRDMRIWYQD